MNPWFFAGICVGLFLLLWVYAARKWKQQAQTLAARRPNPTKDEFAALLAEDCDAGTAAFLWDECADSWPSGLTPHPDDDYLNDLPIDPGEQEDWFRNFCDAHHLREKDFPNWPEGQSTTVRHFARWLSDGRRASK